MHIPALSNLNADKFDPKIVETVDSEYLVHISVAAAPAWSRLRAVADTGSEPSQTKLIPSKEAASQIQFELRLRLRSRLKPAWPSS